MNPRGANRFSHRGGNRPTGRGNFNSKRNDRISVNQDGLDSERGPFRGRVRQNLRQTRQYNEADSNTARPIHRRRDFFQDKLKNWLEIKDSGTLIIQMCLDKNSFEEFLSQEDVIVGEEIMHVLNALEFAMTAHHQRQSIKEVLEVICKSQFLEKKVLMFLVNKRLYEDSWSEAKQVFCCLVCILEEILDKMPTYVHQCVTMTSHLLGMTSFFTHLKSDSELEQSLKSLRARSVERAEKYKEDDQAESSMFFDSRDSEQPPEDFTTLSVVPTIADLREDVKPFLRPAIVKGVYSDAKHYLDIQFRLMKQDFLHPLRLGINEFIRAGCKKDFWSSDIRIYVNVHIEDMQSKDAIDHVLRFDVSKLKNVKWDVSKRLIFGSLLCLSKDNFQSVIFATVANRDVKSLRQGYITVNVKTGLDVVFSSSTSDTFVMVETTAYFESYQHVLKGLQEMSSYLPLQDYIIKCQKNIGPPKYLLKTGRVPEYDIKCLTYLGNPTSIPVLTTVKWPPANEMCLNESQREAAQMALTKEIALIQGPPGTGKTYVGLKVMETLLSNKFVRTGMMIQSDPILVVCYTNHALDQFLEGVLTFCNNGIIRVGGKSSSDILEKFNLKNVKQEFRREKLTSVTMRAAKAICLQGLKEFTNKIKMTCDEINNLDIDILDANLLKKYISKEHYESLCRNPITSKQSSMKQWLNVSNASTEKVIPALIKKHLTGLVLNWRRSEYVGVTEMMGIVERASLYTYMVTEYRRALYEELTYLSQFPPDYYIQGKMNNLQSMFQLSFTSILPDQLLQWVLQGRFFIEKFLHILSSNLLKYHADEYTDRLTECWLLGLHKNLNNQLNDIQALTDKRVGNTSTENEFDDTEASKEAQDARIIDDGDDSDDEDGVEGTKSMQGTTFSKNSLASVMQRMDMLGIQDDTTDMSGDQTNEEWTTVKYKKPLNSQKLRRKLVSLKPMPEDEVSKVIDVWALEPNRRFSLYKYWIQQYRKDLTKLMQNLVINYTELYEKKQQLNTEETLTLLRKAEVIGMTTTGAAKHRAVLQALGCRIIVVEEAAEVLESHIVTALNKNCNHLILIGDHQQLRPNPTVYELAKYKGLEISLFERLIINEVPHVLLKEQHRMRPEISKIMKHIYKHLKDHESVEKYEKVLGVSKNIFLINHKEQESHVDDTMSKSNKHEAKYATALCRYFLLLGYDPEKITVLATYLGQVFAIKKIMAETKFPQRVRVTAVDNYQGEENDIIILSLVRSNAQHRVGFLKVDNRVCVALSRAKKGLYIIGNFDLLASQSKLWKDIIQTAKEDNIIGEGLPVCCANHPEFKEFIITDKDFEKCPDGGCGKPCGFRLTCGHVCPRTCHGKDNEHKEFKCTKQCIKTCPEGHGCKRKCFQACGDCDELVTKKITSCGHEDKVPCHLTEDKAVCSQACLVTLPCGHPCPGRCGVCRKNNRHDDCLTQAPFIWPCGHRSPIECSKLFSNIPPCPKKCETILDCGHVCKGSCSDCLDGLIHVACGEKCQKTLPCGHQCQGYCGSQCLPCAQKCPNQCGHGPCSKGKSGTQLCGSECPPCQEQCKYSCIHEKCPKKCSDYCSVPPCSERCVKQVHNCTNEKKCNSKLHYCTHRCYGLCGERCVCAVCEVVLRIRTTEGEVTADDAAAQLNEVHIVSDDDEDDEDVEEDEEKATSQKTKQKILVMKLHCGHIFRVDELDQYVNTLDPEGCQYLKCPECHKLITYNQRYSHVIRDRIERREARKAELRKETGVTREDTKKLVLSEKELDDTPFTSGFKGSNLEIKRLKSEVQAMSFQFKSAYVLNTICSLGTENEKEAQPIKKALQKVDKRVTTQQKNEFTSELFKLLLLAHLRKLERLMNLSYRQIPPQMDRIRVSLNERKMERERLIKCEEILWSISQSATKDPDITVHDVAEYTEMHKVIEMAKKVIDSSIDQMLCDIIHPLTTDYTVTASQQDNNYLNESPSGLEERSTPTDRISDKLSHNPMSQITVPMSSLTSLPSLQEWGKKWQTKPGPPESGSSDMYSTRPTGKVLEVRSKLRK
ncbi:NFX1-type zinc finger-containing protein 1 [Bulinus truncatus]|nr:NFX1-type zinc finger-containing protein 1 [Bulinus truncatus]